MGCFDGSALYASAVPDAFGGQTLGSHHLNTEGVIMIFGAHVVLYSKDAEADRLFFKNILGLSWVDAGHGWLIFALPPAEVAIHPAQENGRHELYLMCENLSAEMASLAGKGIECSPPEEARWGSVTSIELPGGGLLGLYQPRHKSPAARTGE
jgi:hypothetical protein